jgi:hypothetical protein
MQRRSLFQQDHRPHTFLQAHNKQCHSTSFSPDLTHIVVPNSLIVACTATKSNSCRYKLDSRSFTSTGLQALSRARNQFSDLEHDDGLLEYPEDIFGIATLNGSVETALADVERLGQKRAGLKIEEKNDGLPLCFFGESESPPHPHVRQYFPMEFLFC